MAGGSVAGTDVVADGGVPATAGIAVNNETSASSATNAHLLFLTASPFLRAGPTRGTRPTGKVG